MVRWVCWVWVGGDGRLEKVWVKKEWLKGRKRRRCGGWVDVPVGMQRGRGWGCRDSHPTTRGFRVTTLAYNAASTSSVQVMEELIAEPEVYPALASPSPNLESESNLKSRPSSVSLRVTTGDGGADRQVQGLQGRKAAAAGGGPGRDGSPG